MERVIYDRLRALESTHWWFTARRKLIGQAIETCGLPANARILEAGCGTGGNIELLRRFGTVRAMEPDAVSRAYIGETYGLEVDDGLLPAGLPYAPGSFDLVCAFDVIEHVDDDGASLRSLGELLAPGGVLMVTVPAYQWMWSHHDELHHHKRRYTRGEFVRVVEGAGLSVAKATYFNTVLLPLAVGVRMTKRTLGLKSEDDRMPPPWLNRLLGGVFAAEAPLIRKGALPLGLSILVTAGRPQAA
jgi:SAM-dependent methyltransferase